MRCFYKLCVFFLCVYPLNVHSFSLPDLGNDSRAALTPSEEALIGQSWMRELRASGVVSFDPIIQEYLDILGRRLSFALPSKQNFHLIAINSAEYNAFAFFDRHIAIHIGLINLVETESELASVCAHEMAHITQQHLVRQLATQRKLMPITIAEALAAIAIGTPDLAIAALAGHYQQLLNYSREFEQEADRIGIDILQKAHFDPQGMPDTFTRMKKAHQYYGRPPEYLLTHPLYESRISDSRERAQRYPYQQVTQALLFYLIKARAYVLTNPKTAEQYFSHQIKSGKSAHLDAARYGLGFAYYQQEQYAKVTKILSPLLRKYPDSTTIQLLYAEALAEQSLKDAHSHLKKLLSRYPHHGPMLLAIAGIELQLDQAKQAEERLLKYTEGYPDDPTGFQLLMKTEAKLGNPLALHQANAKWHLLMGNLQEAKYQIELAKQQSKDPKSTHQLKKMEQTINVLIDAYKRI